MDPTHFHFYKHLNDNASKIERLLDSISIEIPIDSKIETILTELTSAKDSIDTLSDSEVEAISLFIKNNITDRSNWSSANAEEFKPIHSHITRIQTIDDIHNDFIKLQYFDRKKLHLLDLSDSLLLACGRKATMIKMPPLGNPNDQEIQARVNLDAIQIMMESMIERVTDPSFLCDGVEGVENISVYLNNLQVAYWICIKHRHESKQDLKKKYTSYSFKNNDEIGAIKSCKSIDSDISKVLSENPTEIYEIIPPGIFKLEATLKTFRSLEKYNQFQNLVNTIYILKEHIHITTTSKIPKYMQYLQPTVTGWKISDLTQFTSAVNNKSEYISNDFFTDLFQLHTGKSSGILGLAFTKQNMDIFLKEISNKYKNWTIKPIKDKNKSYETSQDVIQFNAKSQDWDAMCEQLFYKNMNIDSICLGSAIDRNNHVYLYHEKYGY